jgi:hypothetical protein
VIKRNLTVLLSVSYIGFWLGEKHVSISRQVVMIEESLNAGLVGRGESSCASWADCVNTNQTLRTACKSDPMSQLSRRMLSESASQEDATVFPSAELTSFCSN